MLYTLKNDKLEISVSTLGGELLSIINKKNGKEYLWQGNPEYWTGHAPNPFPIVGRVKEGKYNYKGVEYSIKSPHGFNRISELKCIENTATTLVFNLKYSEATLKAYPFKFDYKIRFELCENNLKTEYIVKNLDEKIMLFNVGGHPGFNLPINEGEKFEDYYLEFERSCAPTEIICDNCFITEKRKPLPLKNGKILPLRHNLFDNDAIILEDLGPRKLTIKTDKGDNKIVVDFKDFDYLGIWHKPLVEAPYVCIEPWNGLPSAIDDNEDLEMKTAILSLIPNDVYDVSYTISIF